MLAALLIQRPLPATMARLVEPDDVLILRRRRILSRTERTEDGGEVLRVFYRDIRGKYPDHETPVRLSEEDAAA